MLPNRSRGAEAARSSFFFLLLSPACGVTAQPDALWAYCSAVGTQSSSAIFFLLEARQDASAVTLEISCVPHSRHSWIIGRRMSHVFVSCSMLQVVLGERSFGGSHVEFDLSIELYFGVSHVLAHFQFATTFWDCYVRHTGGSHVLRTCLSIGGACLPRASRDSCGQTSLVKESCKANHMKSLSVVYRHGVRSSDRVMPLLFSRAKLLSGFINRVPELTRFSFVSQLLNFMTPATRFFSHPLFFVRTVSDELL